MGFLDNSGDIILDAVLTDTGRKRLARGDGSFKVAKFAFADDEINYGLYDKNNASGSASSISGGSSRKAESANCIVGDDGVNC